MNPKRYEIAAKALALNEDGEPLYTIREIANSYNCSPSTSNIEINIKKQRKLRTGVNTMGASLHLQTENKDWLAEFSANPTTQV